MKVYEFGKEHARTFVMFQCAAEPWWAFKQTAEAVATDYHVYLMIADGHDEQGTESSLWKNMPGTRGRTWKRKASPRWMSCTVSLWAVQR